MKKKTFRKNRNVNVVIKMGLPNVFKALSDPIRRDILIMLKKEENCLQEKLQQNLIFPMRQFHIICLC